MKTVQLKLELCKLGDEGYHIFCKGRINGVRARILIDTGASISVINKAFAAEINLTEQVDMETTSTAGINPGGIKAEFLKVDVLKFKKLVIKNLTVGSVDVEHVNQLYSEMNIKPFDFILGGEVLERCGAVINYLDNTLTFQSPKYKLAF